MPATPLPAAENLPASLIARLDEDEITIAEWAAMTDKQRQFKGLTVEEHTDAFADYTDEELEALQQPLPAWALAKLPGFNPAR